MNNLPHLPLIDGCLFLDNSGWIEPLSLCHRKVEYSKLHNRIAVGERPALNFGSVQHLGCEFRYVRYGSQQVDGEYFDQIGQLFSSFYEKHPCPEGDFRSLNWAIEVNRRYCEKFGVEPFSLLQYDKPIKCPYCEGANQDAPIAALRADAGILASLLREPLPPGTCPWCLGSALRTHMIEMSFALPLFVYEGPSWLYEEPVKVSIPIFYTGRIDLPISSPDGETFILDFKTTSLLGPSIWDQWKRSSQFKGYVWAFRELTGKPVAGYAIRAIRTKEPPLYVTNGKDSSKGKKQTPEQWWDESIPDTHYFRVSDVEIAEWKANVIAKVEQFLWNYSRGVLPSADGAACTLYGKCQYFDVCNQEPADRLDFLSSGLFTPNLWSPLAAVK